MSSIDFCEQSWFLNYGLGIEDTPHIKTVKGSVVHKVLELLAVAQLNKQQGNKTFFDKDLNTHFDIDLCNGNSLFDPVFNDFAKDDPRLNQPALNKELMGETDKKKYYEVASITHKEDCLKSINKALAFENGAFDPANSYIVSPEQHFDFPVMKKWASYRDESGNVVQLRVKGTMDLLTRESEDPLIYHLKDYKTGRVWDWGKDKEKTYDSLMNDTQLRLYHYAACILYPEIESILVTIYFINYDKPFTFAFERDELPQTEQIIKKYYKRMIAVERPKLSKSWKCKSFCYFGKNLQPGTDQTICEFFKDKIYQIGMDKTIEGFANKEKLGQYSGGGKVITKEE
jgi:hypothetical protein